MKTRCLAILTVLLVVACPTVAAADSPGVSVERFKVTGIVESTFGDCPQVDVVPSGTVCREAVVTLWNEGAAIDGGGLAQTNTPWRLWVFQATLTFGDVAGEPVESDLRWGYLPVVEPADMTFDRQHLMFASVSTEVAMSDGTTANVDFHWQATSDRILSGNNGYALSDWGLLHHFVDQCLTHEIQAHQKVRIAVMSGTFDGVPVHSYTVLPFSYIASNQFVYIDVIHGPRCA